MKIGLDFDGVIIDCGNLKMVGAIELFGIYIPEEKFKKEIVIGENLLTVEQYRELQEYIYENPDVGLKMKPVEGALEYLPRLINDGHQVKIITSRIGKSLEVAKQWSSNQVLKLDIIGVNYGESKAQAAVGLDLFVDDGLDKLNELIGIVPRLYMFTWGYNDHIDAGKKIQRLASWKQLYSII
jgi:hypothetical protein